MRATEDRQAIARALHGSRIWDEVVIGRESVTVQFDPSALGPAKALAMLKQAAMADINAAVVDAPNLKLLVRSDEANAPDLADCAAANNCSSNEFLNILARSNLSVDMLGFAPGFAYLSGVDPNLLGGRLDHPRQRVKAGSIGFIKRLSRHLCSGRARGLANYWPDRCDALRQNGARSFCPLAGCRSSNRVGLT